jgi:3-phosphoshikimate 1-carboxyvinyltransferase
MEITLKPSRIHGNISAPASKSMMIRAIVAATLCNGKTIISNFTTCNDAEAAINIAKSLGSEVKNDKNKLEITGSITNKPTLINCGESALCTRIFAPVAAVFSNEFEITGSHSLLRRDMSDMLQALNLLGLQCEDKKYLPFKIKGKLEGRNIKINGSSSSQTLSGLLMALPLCQNNSTIEVENLNSKPYVDLTISVLADFGINIINENYQKFLIKGNQKYKPCIFNIEGDWSGISCMLVAAAIGGKIMAANLNPKSQQADIAILDVLRLCGANVKIENDKITVEKQQLYAFDFNATDCPDLFPAIAALAANCNGTSTVKGVHRLQNKESDRAKILQQEFAKLGVKIDIKDDQMYICGSKINSVTTHAHNDHRIAMALAVASINANGSITIENSECVSKSYPDFWENFLELTQ